MKKISSLLWDSIVLPNATQKSHVHLELFKGKADGFSVPPPPTTLPNSSPNLIVFWYLLYSWSLAPCRCANSKPRNLLVPYHLYPCPIPQILVILLPKDLSNVFTPLIWPRPNSHLLLICVMQFPCYSGSLQSALHIEAKRTFFKVQI